MKPFLIGIAGGTGSGKTTFADHIASRIGPERVTIIDADSYYHDLSHLPPEKRHHINFDHPEALDTPLLTEHVMTLIQGRSVSKQPYDFTTHTRAARPVTIHPKPLVIVEGILIFALDGVRRLFDLKIFIDEDADIRLLRRIKRDIQERGRGIESVAEQYLSRVRPMHAKFVEPFKSSADIIMHHGDNSSAIIERIKNALK